MQRFACRGLSDHNMWAFVRTYRQLGLIIEQRHAIAMSCYLRTFVGPAYPAAADLC
jgi:hypothetical protein